MQKYTCLFVMLVAACLMPIAHAADSRYQIVAGGYTFDPLSNAPTIPENLQAQYSAQASGYFLVQFSEYPDDADLAWLDAQVQKRIWHQSGTAYLVKCDAARLGTVKLDSRIRWSGPFHPAYRATANLKEKLAEEYGKKEYEQIQVCMAAPDGKRAHEALLDLGADPVRDLIPNTIQPIMNCSYRLDQGLIDDVLKIEGVLWVGPYYEPRLNDERSDQILAGNYNASYQPTGATYQTWLTSRGVNGSGVIIEVADSGLCTGNQSTLHQDLRGRVAFTYDTTGQGWRDVIGHGTNCTGIIAGNATIGTTDASGYRLGLGVAPSAQVGMTRIFNDSGSFTASDLYATTQNAYNNGARLSSQSWGSSPYTCSGYPMTYSSQCVDYDTFVRDAASGTSGNQQFCIFNSAGNDGDCYSSTSSPGNCGDPAIAKNLVTVGASENYRMEGTDGCGVANAQADNGNDKISFSSVGNTSDGRIKPDVMAPGTHINSMASQYSGYTGAGVCDQYWPSAQTNYNWCSGTSQACPHAAGAGALFHQWYNATYSTPPSPALIKAALINGADDMSGGQSGHSSPSTLPAIPNRYQGWGRINLSKTVNNGVNMIYYDQSTTLGTNGTYYEVTYMVANGSLPVKATLVWTDAPGTPGGTILKNDLNLTVTGGSTYLGNVFSGGWSTTGGSADTVNNVECVYIQSPSGTYTFRVTANALNGDGVPGNADTTDQDFALVLYNVIPVGPTWTPTSTPTPLPAPVYQDSFESGVYSCTGPLGASGCSADWGRLDPMTQLSTPTPACDGTYIAWHNYEACNSPNGPDHLLIMDGNTNPNHNMSGYCNLSVCLDWFYNSATYGETMEVWVACADFTTLD